MSKLIQDLRYAARMLAKAPGFTPIAIITLALGIGANAAIFSVADALLLRPEPFPNLGRLVLMFNKIGSLTDENSMYPADYEAIRTQSHSFEQLGAYFNRNVSLTGKGDPEREEATKVTTNFFDMLGVKPLLGRGFTADEGAPGRDHETVLSYGLWQSKFGGRPNIIGKGVHINGQSFTIIGVMGKNFDYPTATNLWTPIAFVDADKSDRSNNYIFPIGLLKHGVSVSEAVVELTGIGQRLAKEFPKRMGKWEFVRLHFVRTQPMSRPIISCSCCSPPLDLCC